MSRLDRHVVAVQNKLTLRTLLAALAWSLLVFQAAVALVILAGKLFQLYLPRPSIWFWAGLGVSVALAAAYALWRRPSRHDAAVAIDEKLGLKEKFSTALHVRASKDPFAAAVVRDAEQTAESVSLQNQFRPTFPKPFIAAIIVGVLAGLATKLPAFDLFGAEENRKNAAAQQRAEAEVRDQVKRALAEIATAPPEVQEDVKIQAAKRDFEALLRRPIKEPNRVRPTVLKALEDVQAIKQKIENAKNFAEAEQDMKMLGLKGPKDDETGPVADALREMQKGDFTEAINQLNGVAAKFDKMDKQEQEKAVEQMKNLAQQLQQKANDPKVQQQIQKQLQNLGAGQKQAQQMAQKMQQAANGDKKAQQQLQQMANQLQQQMNGGQGPNPQQQQQIQKMMQQMQAQANAQQNAANLAQGAQQMAQAMQQAQQGQQNGQQGGQQQNAQAMNQGQKAMQQAIQQMQAQNQAAQAAAAQQQAQAGGQQGGNQPGQQGNNPGQGQGQNPQAGNQPPQQGNNGGQGGFAQAAGGRPKGEVTPFSTQQVVAPSQDNEKGKILASSFVKAASERGESEAELQEVLEREYNESTDEVEQDRIPAQAREAVKDYFDSVKADPQQE